ncbi:AzlD family protein [Vogesella indigofera]|uniref:AzlD family protein n=1 Tax=Vogesella indigofera TaxID=45465 RepID=UPI00234F40FC|nr:AzlD family protein [Vogesella indigofera]MDC7699439.1 AzlD family protein [Vogesella indigofera]
MTERLTLLTIVLMAASTYLTRVLGYLALRKRTLSPRLLAVMDCVPGCVLVSVIAPAFVSEQPANWLALAITLLAASRLPLLPTVIIGIVATGMLRHLLGT